MSLPFLYTNGKAFVEDGGERRWVWKGSSDFKLFARYMDGEDITPVLRQRQEVGANILRVFLMYDGALGRFHPWEHDWPSFFRSFIPLVGAHGLRVKFDVCADAQVAMSELWMRQMWFRDITTTAAEYANIALISAGNEWPQNGFKPTDFTRPTNTGRLLLARGSSVGDAPPWGHYGDPYIDQWDFIEWHSRRDSPKYLLDNDAWFIGDGQVRPVEPPSKPARPIVDDEPIGASENPQPGRRYNDTYSAQALALKSRIISGMTFHSDQGINSELWTGNTLKCAEACFRVLNAYIGEDY